MDTTAVPTMVEVTLHVFKIAPSMRVLSRRAKLLKFLRPFYPASRTIGRPNIKEYVRRTKCLVSMAFLSHEFTSVWPGVGLAVAVRPYLLDVRQLCDGASLVHVDTRFKDAFVVPKHPFKVSRETAVCLRVLQLCAPWLLECECESSTVARLSESIFETLQRKVDAAAGLRKRMREETDLLQGTNASQASGADSTTESDTDEEAEFQGLPKRVKEEVAECTAVPESTPPPPPVCEPELMLPAKVKFVMSAQEPVVVVPAPALASKRVVKVTKLPPALKRAPAPALVRPALVPVQPAPAPVPVQPAPALVQPAPALVQPAPALVQPALVPVQPAPAPVEPVPAPVQPAPVPVQPAPVPVQPAPVPVQPAPVPVQPAPAPVRVTPNPFLLEKHVALYELILRTPSQRVRDATACLRIAFDPLPHLLPEHADVLALLDVALRIPSDKLDRLREHLSK